MERTYSRAHIRLYSNLLILFIEYEQIGVQLSERDRRWE